ncbi:uncharacterized protein BJ171DRAFT_150416 [Polychytrium aggregatum]|uniref:uncharacterized protein n=1 Tax=Polychytrium aggregatum TaxID=110093 RepID=UPI0022FEC585|nr:uncharacterized protein BJ171DRAFT_150416 [Polychytrium aggregatum]KAI9203355.1 hypothetical protein BJ171DRAFT_150416 [Polychytrium aggregatum]
MDGDGEPPAAPAATTSGASDFATHGHSELPPSFDESIGYSSSTFYEQSFLGEPVTNSSFVQEPQFVAETFDQAPLQYGSLSHAGSLERLQSQSSFRPQSQGSFERPQSQSSFGRLQSQGSFGRTQSQSSFGRPSVPFPSSADSIDQAYPQALDAGAISQPAIKPEPSQAPIPSPPVSETAQEPQPSPQPEPASEGDSQPPTRPKVPPQNEKSTLSRVFTSRKDWKCRSGYTAHDFFISYRVSSEHNLAEKLALYLQSSEFTDRLKAYTKGGAPKLPHVYLDVNCLVYGKAWEQGFLSGLVNSKIAILLISDQALERVRTADKPDNLLLEWEFAVDLCKTGKLEIVPFLVAEESGDVISLFRSFNLDQFPDELHCHPNSPQKHTIRETMAFIFAIQGINCIPRLVSNCLSQLATIYANTFDLQNAAAPPASPAPTAAAETTPVVATPPPLPLRAPEVVQPPTPAPVAIPQSPSFQFIPGEAMYLSELNAERLTPLGCRLYSWIFDALDASVFPERTSFLEATKMDTFHRNFFRGYDDYINQGLLLTRYGNEFEFYQQLGVECAKIPPNIEYHDLGYAITRTGFQHYMFILLNCSSRSELLIQHRQLLKFLNLDIPLNLSMFPAQPSFKISTQVAIAASTRKRLNSNKTIQSLYQFR